MSLQKTYFFQTLCLVSMMALNGITAAEPLKEANLTVKVHDTVESTVITAKTQQFDPAATLRIDWKSHASPKKFQSNRDKEGHLISTYRLGDTTITRTVILDKTTETLFVHALADQPGDLSLTVKLEGRKPISIHDRRELVLSAEEAAAHAWILPFESDVKDDGKSIISVSGEGEILIILRLTATPAETHIGNTLQLLGQKYDPDHSLPNPHLIWQGVQSKK